MCMYTHTDTHTSDLVHTQMERQKDTNTYVYLRQLRTRIRTTRRHTRTLTDKHSQPKTTHCSVGFRIVVCKY